VYAINRNRETGEISKQLSGAINDDRLTYLYDNGINIVRKYEFEKSMLKSSSIDYINYIKF
jgi:hypothetical protein